MKEGWKKEFRDSLSGYSEPAPEGLFEDIMASYEAASAKSRDRRRVLAVILPGLAAAGENDWLLQNGKLPPGLYSGLLRPAPREAVP